MIVRPDTVVQTLASLGFSFALRMRILILIQKKKVRYRQFDDNMILNIDIGRSSISQLSHKKEKKTPVPISF